ncbi:MULTISPECIES: SDR family oxidoreductase [Clostridium]|uniref:SDR family oxidoreductase n=1 Tax=Clostridium senegalense TaxID=1465809 RepID=A0A6M0H5P3_9CLOT|nr:MULTISPECIES: SDR family oxidoreductase [Clostridium]NEU05191.1 SDR family oxidoreductase [Clostridium senegalense]
MENSNKKILLTGGTQGIGETTVHLLAKMGYEVHITYRSSSEKAKKLTEQYSGKVFAYKLDQGDPEAIKKAEFLTKHSWDGIIFNAALGSGTVKDYAKDDDNLGFERDEAMFKVNALGPLWIYKVVKENLLKKESKSKLIFISSVGGGLAAFPYFTLSDGMSKSAVAFLGKQLAAENTHTLIDVFVVCPGATETPMFVSSTLSKMSHEERKKFDLAQSKQRLIQPDEISYWIEKLLREESTVLHGAVIDATMGLASRPGIQTEAGLSH